MAEAVAETVGRDGEAVAGAVVLVRYFAGAMAAAGTEQEQVPMPATATVGDLADELARRHGSALEAVLEVASFLVDAVATPREGALAGAAGVDVLPPFAGG